ncbi:MAG TPA: hypothetical protein VFQ53_35355 [Kofleriaceae bacterium]|nr:hypothetical protein [Kofleriaceae bacterium]
MSGFHLFAILLASGSLLPACGDNTDDPDPGLQDGPDDGRRPELGEDPAVVRRATTTMAAGLAQAAQTGAVIEAKYELGDDGQLSLSTYPLGASIALDAERNRFQELAGDPTPATWAPSLEPFHDEEHLVRSSRDLTLVQLGSLTLADAVDQESDRGVVYWAVPTVHGGRPGYGTYALDDRGKSTYRFVDNGADRTSGVLDLGTSPGAGATDARAPELGDDVAIVRTSKIAMSAALAQVERDHGVPIEAKLEVGDDGALSLSVYPAQDIAASAEHNTFTELAGDPTAAAWTPSSETFEVPDEEHLTRAARDLTLVQCASLTLRDAVAKVEAMFPGSVVYWAIPTQRERAAGYGIYVLDAQNVTHYLFVH